jgi:hypothetical protein
LDQLLGVEGQSSLFKNISFMVITGFILELRYFQGLYSALFCFVCSSIGYYRGISQYFCYKLIGNVKSNHHCDLKEILTLYAEYLKDENALQLTTRLDEILSNYKVLINGWNIYDNLLNRKPSLNGQIINDDPYLDKLKILGN